jgi:hypothetical protein
VRGEGICELVLGRVDEVIKDGRCERGEGEELERRESERGVRG